MRPTSNTTTAADVGEALGVSASTVAAVMRGSHSVKPATAAKVREMARKLGYVNRGRGGKQSTIRSRRVHDVAAAPRREDYLVGLSRQVGAACSLWLEDRGIKSNPLNPTCRREWALLARGDAKDIEASDQDSGGIVMSC